MSKQTELLIAAKIAKEEKEQAEIQAKKDKEEAIKAERQRQKEIDEEAENLEYQIRIYKDVVDALLPYVNNNMEATVKTKAIISGIAMGKIPYISLRF